MKISILSLSVLYSFCVIAMDVPQAKVTAEGPKISGHNQFDKALSLSEAIFLAKLQVSGEYIEYPHYSQPEIRYAHTPSDIVANLHQTYQLVKEVTPTQFNSFAPMIFKLIGSEARIYKKPLKEVIESYPVYNKLLLNGPRYTLLNRFVTYNELGALVKDKSDPELVIDNIPATRALFALMQSLKQGDLSVIQQKINAWQALKELVPVNQMIEASVNLFGGNRA